MSIVKRYTASMIVASSILYAAQAVAAGESGSFSYVASLVYDYTTLEHAGQTFTGGPLHGTVTVTESSGGPMSIDTTFLRRRLNALERALEGLRRHGSAKDRKAAPSSGAPAA